MNTHSEELSFNNFSIKNLVDYNSLCILGCRTPIRDKILENILEVYNNIPEKIFISPEDEYDHSIINNYDVVKLHTLCTDTISSLLIKQNNKCMSIIDPIYNDDFEYEFSYNNKFNKFNKDSSALVILNCCLNEKIIDEPIFKELLFNFKQKRIIVVVVSPTPIMRDPLMLSNFDYIIINDFQHTPIRDLYSIYASNFINYDQFMRILRDSLRKNSSLVIKNNIAKCQHIDIHWKISYYCALLDEQKNVTH